MIRSESKRKGLYNPFDRYLQCLYVFILLSLPFLLLLANQFLVQWAKEYTDAEKK